MLSWQTSAIFMGFNQKKKEGTLRIVVKFLKQFMTLS